MDVVLVSPGVFFIAVAFPGDQKLELIMEVSAIEDSLNFIFGFSVNDLWVWRWLWTSSDNRVFQCSEEFDDIEYGVESVHGVGKAKTIGVLSNSTYYWVGP